MPRLIVTSPVSRKVLPVDGIPRDDLEHGARVVPPALDEPAPLLTCGHRERRELGAAAPDPGAVDPRHEAAHAAPAPGVGAPVKVVSVVTPGPVPLRPEALDPHIGAPALEGADSVLDAADWVGARDDGYG